MGRRIVETEGITMKRIVFVALIAGVAACSQPAPAPEPTAEATTAEAAPAAAGESLAADGKPSFGKFQVTRANGDVMTDDVRPDGTYVTTMADGKTETGKWEQKGPNVYCATPDKEGAVQKCYEEQVDDKGVYTSKDPETGEVSTVVRL
jgi:hypothetical protein